MCEQTEDLIRNGLTADVQYFGQSHLENRSSAAVSKHVELIRVEDKHLQTKLFGLAKK